MPFPETSIAKLHQDHAYMDALIQQIASLCLSRGSASSCGECRKANHQLCRANVDQLIHNFIQVVLKHNLLESLYMEQSVPEAHRTAHNRAHLRIAEELDAVHAVFSNDGNSLLAIEGIDRVRETLHRHHHEFDTPLQSLLRAA
jgi:bacterioferritin-associated ferredoxin